jgi:hypothetical protein
MSGSGDREPKKQTNLWMVISDAIQAWPTTLRLAVIFLALAVMAVAIHGGELSIPGITFTYMEQNQ